IAAHIDRRPWRHGRTDTLHRGPNDHRLAVGDSTLGPARVIAQADRVPLSPPNEVLYLGSIAGSRDEAVANLDPFDRVNAHNGLGKPTIQLAVPVEVAPQSGDHPPRYRLHHAPQGLPILLGLVDAGHHLLGCR